MPGTITYLKRLILFITVILNGVCPLTGQDSRIYLNRFTPADGLASSEINTLFQDAQHSIWIGHKAGISRYDGYTFENFPFAGEQRIGTVYAVVEGTDGTIWVAAEEGLFYYGSYRMRYVDLDTKTSSIYALALDARGDLWVGTGEGLAVLSRSVLDNAVIHKDGSTQQAKTIATNTIRVDGVVEPRGLLKP